MPGRSSGDLADFLGLGLFNSHQRGIAQLVDAALDGQHSRKGHADVLEPAVFQLTLDANRRPFTSTCMMIVECGRPINSASTTPVWP